MTADRYTTDDPGPKRTTRFQPALNPELGVEMAINGAFGGTPDIIHDGTDTIAYTGSNITGTKVVFDSTDTFTNWPPAGTKSIEANKPIVGDIWQFDRGSDVDLSNFIAFTMKIFVVSGWNVGNSIKVYGFDTGTGLQVGDSVLIENFINEQNVNVPQTVAIPLVVMGLESSTIDAIRIEVVSKSGPGVVFYADMIQIEETSGSKAFLIEAPAGTILSISELMFTYIDGSDSTLANSSMPNFDHSTILGVPKLANGITFTQVIDGGIVFDATITCLADSSKGGSTFVSEIGTANGSHITVLTKFAEPVELDSRQVDFIGVIINDDLTGLTSFTAIAKGFTVRI